MTHPHLAWLLTALLGVAGSSSACSGVVLSAPRLVVDVVPQGVALDIVSRDERVPSGETVVTVHNQSDREVRVLLLKDAPPIGQIPAEVLRAVSPLDSSYVVAASNAVKKRKNELAGGGLGYQVYDASFHVHFAKGHHYTVIAVGAGRVDGIVIEAGSKP